MAAPRRSKKVEAPPVLEIDGVPTVAGLVKMGREYAYVVPRPGGAVTHVTQKGHDLMGEALHKLGIEGEFSGKGNWVRPPSSGKRRD